MITIPAKKFWTSLAISLAGFVVAYLAAHLQAFGLDPEAATGAAVSSIAAVIVAQLNELRKEWAKQSPPPPAPPADLHVFDPSDQAA